MPHQSAYDEMKKWGRLQIAAIVLLMGAAIAWVLFGCLAQQGMNTASSTYLGVAVCSTVFSAAFAVIAFMQGLHVRTLTAPSGAPFNR